MAQGPGEQGHGQGGIETGGRGAVFPTMAIELFLIDTDAGHAPNTWLGGWWGRSFVMIRHWAKHTMRRPGGVTRIHAIDQAQEIHCIDDAADRDTCTKDHSFAASADCGW
jgi:hypothetical protein